MRSFTIEDPSPVIESDSIRQYEYRQKVCTFAPENESVEDVLVMAVSVAGNSLSFFTAIDAITNDCLPSGSKRFKAVIAKCVRLHIKDQKMRNKGNLKKCNVFVGDD